MGKREVFDKIFIGILGLALVSVFIPCNQIDAVSTTGITKSQYYAILDSRIGIMHIVFPIVVAFVLIWGKYKAASVLGILLSGLHFIILFYYLQQGDYLHEIAASDSPFSIFMKMSDIESVNNVHPFGYYLAIGAAGLLLITSIIGFFIKEDEY